MTDVLQRSETGGTTRLVLLVLANYYGEDGAWPSIDRLAHDTRMSRRAVQDCLRRAEARGELHIQPNAGKHGTNLYGLHLRAGGCRICTGAGVRRESAPEPKELDLPRSTQAISVGTPTQGGSGGELSPFADLAFEEFWIRWPRKRSKAAARRAYLAALKRGGLSHAKETAEAIYTGLERALPDFRRRPTDRIPYAGTWLNADGWLDEVDGPDDAYERRMRLIRGEGA